MLLGPGANAVEAACAGLAGLVAELEVRNDQSFDRGGETAFAGVPIGRPQGLVDVSELWLSDESGAPLDGQFRLLARWGGVADDPALPIRWLEVAVQSPARASGTDVVCLRRSSTPPAPSNPLLVQQQGTSYVVDTGAAVFGLDSTSPAGLASVEIGGTTVYRHQPGAGPRLTLGTTVLDGSTAGAVVLDTVGFEVLDSGPLKASFAYRGHMVDPSGRTACSVYEPDPPRYEATGFTAVWTFYRGSAVADLELEVRNECLAAWIQPYSLGTTTWDGVSWVLPFQASQLEVRYGGSGSLSAATAPVEVRQLKGGGSPWRRRAAIRVGGVPVDSAEAYDAPFVAVHHDSGAMAAQLAWMRFREPQALVVTASALEVGVVGETLAVGGGKGLWNRIRFTFAAGAPSTALWEDERQRGQAALERGLLVWMRGDDRDAALVLPPPRHRQRHLATRNRLRSADQHLARRDDRPHRPTRRGQDLRLPALARHSGGKLEQRRERPGTDGQPRWPRLLERPPRRAARVPPHG